MITLLFSGGLRHTFTADAVVLAVGTAPSYVDIAQVLDIDGPGLALAAVDVRERSSAWWSGVGGLRDAGTITFQIVYDPSDATHAAVGSGLAALLAGGQSADWRVTWPGGRTFKAGGCVTGFAASGPLSDEMTADITVQLTSAPEMT